MVEGVIPVPVLQIPGNCSIGLDITAHDQKRGAEYGKFIEMICTSRLRLEVQIKNWKRNAASLDVLYLW
jgi:hypothetical protein